MNVNLSWKDPTTRADGSPLAPEEIQHIAVLLAVGGETEFTLLNTVLPGVQAFTQTDLPPGTYQFKLVAVDNQRVPQSSAGVVVEVVIEEPLKPAPGEVTDVIVSVE